MEGLAPERPRQLARQVIEWVAEMAGTRAAAVSGAMQHGRIRPTVRANGRPRARSRAEPGAAPECYLAAEARAMWIVRTALNCSLQEETPGPNNNWMGAGRNARDAAGLREKRAGSRLHGGRTLYVVTVLEGPLRSPIAHIGVEISRQPVWCVK